MHYQFFTVPCLDAQAAATDLNAFLQQHKIYHVEQQLIADGANSYWAFQLSYLPGQKAEVSPQPCIPDALVGA